MARNAKKRGRAKKPRQTAMTSADAQRAMDLLGIRSKDRHVLSSQTGQLAGTARIGEFKVAGEISFSAPTSAQSEMFAFYERRKLEASRGKRQETRTQRANTKRGNFNTAVETLIRQNPNSTAENLRDYMMSAEGQRAGYSSPYTKTSTLRYIETIKALARQNS